MQHHIKIKNIKHYTIPVFIPELACPFQCIFCDQRKITGKDIVPSDEEIINSIESYLSSFSRKNRYVEVGFFGGSFTGLTPEKQLHYLELVHPFIKTGSVNSIRLSTRPDYISKDILDNLKKYYVSTIELGAQSTSDEVLKNSGRGHSSEVIYKSSRMIKDAGFRLGLQMMIGLPGDSFNRSVKTAQDFIYLKADDTRIYPALVIKGTKLQKLYESGRYVPLSLEESIRWAGEIMLLFEIAGVNIIRVGLHPSEGLLEGESLIAGPFHPSFRELVNTEIWSEKLKGVKIKGDKKIVISVNPEQFNFAIGYQKKNKEMLLQKFSCVTFLKDKTIDKRSFHVDYY